MACAVITGITGQDGSYLAEFLLSKGYTVYGLVRRSSTHNTQRIDHILDKITLIQADMTDQMSLMRALYIAQPDEVYNLAAMSYVQTSFTQPVATAEYNALSVVKLLEAIKMLRLNCRFYQASTSEMFGKVDIIPQSEYTPFHPRSPYGVAKLYGHYITNNFRESYAMHASSGILFNHESPRRGLEFVTRKISHGVAAISLGRQDYLELGNIDAKRDWGFAGDYVKAMWLMLQQDEPDDYVIATGKMYTVKDFITVAFQHVGIADPEPYVKINQGLYRPAEVDLLVGDATKAKRKLGWQPETSFHTLVKMMVESDIELIRSKS